MRTILTPARICALRSVWPTGPAVPVCVLFANLTRLDCITQGTCGVHVGELTGLLWGVNFGVNIPKYCEMTYSHLRQRACPDSPGPVLHPGDVWEVPGYFYPSCSGVQGAVNLKTLFSCSQRWSEPDFGDLPSSPQIYPEGNWHCSEVYGSYMYAKYL